MLPSCNREERTIAHFKEAKAIWTRFVPKSGQAETVQGQLLRAVEKLRDGAIRNGSGNWDQGFEMLLDYLQSHLSDTAVFPSDVIRQTDAILTRLADHRNLVLEDEPYEELGDRVVEYSSTTDLSLTRPTLAFAVDTPPSFISRPGLISITIQAPG